MNVLHDCNVDFRRGRICGGWLFVRRNEKYLPVHITDCTRHSLIGDVYDSEECISEGEEIPDGEFDMELPDIGMIEHEGSVWYITKYNKRKEYHRSLLYNSRQGWIFNPIPRIVNPIPFMTFTHALYKYKNRDIKSPSVLDKDLCIVDDVLYFRLLPVGKVDKENKQVLTSLTGVQWLGNSIGDLTINVKQR